MILCFFLSESETAIWMSCDVSIYVHLRNRSCKVINIIWAFKYYYQCRLRWFWNTCCFKSALEFLFVKFHNISELFISVHCSKILAKIINFDMIIKFLPEAWWGLLRKYFKKTLIILSQYSRDFMRLFRNYYCHIFLKITYYLSLPNYWCYIYGKRLWTILNYITWIIWMNILIWYWYYLMILA